jgi:hypothetical protein
MLRVKHNPASFNAILKFAICGSIGLALSVPLIAYRSTAKADIQDGALPRIGFPVHDTVMHYLPSGGTILLLSESCDICIARAGSFVSTLSRRPDYLLIVSSDGEARQIRDVVMGDSQIERRTLFLSGSDVVRYVNVSAVPTYVSVDEAGKVLAVGPSTIGWSTTLRPSSWLSGWAQLLR